MSIRIICPSFPRAAIRRANRAISDGLGACRAAGGCRPPGVISFYRLIVSARSVWYTVRVKFVPVGASCGALLPSRKGADRVRTYRIRIDGLSNHRIDEITGFLRQYNDYLAILRGDPISYYYESNVIPDCELPAMDEKLKAWAQYRLDLINRAAAAFDCGADLIAVCCRGATAPNSGAFDSARRSFYRVFDKIL